MMAKAFQERQIDWGFHKTKIANSARANNLAIPSPSLNIRFLQRYHPGFLLINCAASIQKGSPRKLNAAAGPTYGLGPTAKEFYD